jgi:CRISPR-associated protein Cas2
MKPLWLVCYDVSDNRRRQKLAKRMERVCQRVQGSVFECPLDHQEMTHQLEQFWVPVLKLSEDSLRAYPLNAEAKKQAKLYGSPPLYEPPALIVL